MPKHEINRVLIANRGEIACRVIRTCKKLGIRTVAVYSDADANSLFVRSADEAVHIGPPEASKSYLDAEKILQVAKMTKSDAIHPGYGFLSENEHFAERCSQEGIIFIGPTPEAINSMGSKSNSKVLLATRAKDVPLIPGYHGDDQSDKNLTNQALKIGFPVLIKASAGGGGKGMRIVRDEKSLPDAIDSARTEAKNSFGDSKLLIEKYFDTVRHIEYQIFGDNYGNAVHIFERECSVQRRHQKVIEETPSAMMTDELRERMGKAAVTIGKVINYRGAGTVEFIAEPSGKFYFLEVNTRLQVEHPITEAITGMDLVELQLNIAKGFSFEELGITQSKLYSMRRGHAFECRLYAEDPSNNFFPCIGKIISWKQSTSPNVRYDTGIDSGSEISIYYDPLISKIIAWGESREVSRKLMIRALQETVCQGLTTNKKFLIDVLQQENFIKGEISTHFIQLYFPENVRSIANPIDQHSVISAFLFDWNRRNESRSLLKNVPSGWRNNYYKPQSVTFIDTQGNNHAIEYSYKPTRNSRTHQFQLKLNSNSLNAELVEANEHFLVAVVNGLRRIYHISSELDTFYVHSDLTGDFVVFKKSRFPEVETEDKTEGYSSPMPCKVLRLIVKDGDVVKKGDPLLVTESMKMENKIYSKHDGTVKLLVREGELVDAGKILVTVQ